MVIRTHEILTFVIGWTCFKQEAIVYPPWVAMAVRPKPGVWEYVRVNVDEMTLDKKPEFELVAAALSTFMRRMVDFAADFSLDATLAAE